MSAPTEGAGALMDRIYRNQVAIYDLTRKYYLLGRDRLIEELDVPVEGSVLEIACGTGRNLIRIHERYPQARLFGMDISREMLAQAERTLDKRGLDDRILLAQGDACSFDPATLFTRTHFDRIVFSYCLSMIPDWQRALGHAVPLLAPGGRIHIVDFGLQTGLPRWFGKGMYAWLAKFHVTPREGIEAEMTRLAAAHGLTAETRRIYRDYAVIGTLTAPN